MPQEEEEEKLAQVKEKSFLSARHTSATTGTNVLRSRASVLCLGGFKAAIGVIPLFSQLMAAKHIDTIGPVFKKAEESIYFVINTLRNKRIQNFGAMSFSLYLYSTLAVDVV